MYMAVGPDSMCVYVISMLDSGMSREQIEIHLRENGHDEKFVKDLLTESLKLRHAKRRSQGLVLILSGAFICLLSFALTITSTFTQNHFAIVLYGMTSVGIILVVAGFMKVF